METEQDQPVDVITLNAQDKEFLKFLMQVGLDYVLTNEGFSARDHESMDRLKEAADADVTDKVVHVNRRYSIRHRVHGDEVWIAGLPTLGPKWTWQSKEKAEERLTSAAESWPQYEYDLIEEVQYDVMNNKKGKI